MMLERCAERTATARVDGEWPVGPLPSERSLTNDPSPRSSCHSAEQHDRQASRLTIFLGSLLAATRRYQLPGQLNGSFSFFPSADLIRAAHC